MRRANEIFDDGLETVLNDIRNGINGVIPKIPKPDIVPQSLRFDSERNGVVEFIGINPNTGTRFYDVHKRKNDKVPVAKQKNRFADVGSNGFVEEDIVVGNLDTSRGFGINTDVPVGISQDFVDNESPKPISPQVQKASVLSRITGFLEKLNAFATAIQAALRGVKFVIGAIKKFVNGLAELGNTLAETSWRRLRESFAYGTSFNSLARQERAMASIGGDPASASALWGRWSKERSMLAYGGNGGSMMEAARLFGISILGSGEHGFATNEEFLRNVIDAMSKATPERRNAISQTLGLTPYQTWAFSQGQAYYDTLGRKSLVEMIYGDEKSEAMNEISGANAKRFVGSWRSFVEECKELGYTLGDVLLPALTIFIDLCEGIAEIIDAILKPISQELMPILNFFSARWWQDFVATTPTKEQNATQMQAITNNGRSIVINVGDVNMSSLPKDITSSNAADKFAREIFDKLGEITINDRR